MPAIALLPSPRTWAANDIVTVPRLRADMTNLAQLLAVRPLFIGEQVTGAQSIAMSTPTSVTLDTEFADNWNGHGGASGAYTAQLPGWYLCEGSVFMDGTAQTGNISAGIHVVQNSVAANLLCGFVVPDGVQNTCPTSCDLVQLNTFTSDFVSLIADQNVGASQTIQTPTWFKAEWVAMPSSSIAGTYTGPIGTVVSSPKAAALWPPGSGTTITNAGGIAAGATSMTVQSATGMITGGTLGLDYYEGAPVSPVAESVTISSVAGLTIGISATSYPHGGTASPGNVAVPVSASWMNQQCRDIISFLAYPPILRLSNFGTTQSIPGQVFPAATAVTFQSATADNFSGWGGAGTSTYTFPVSGVYFVYGQVFYQASIFNCHAGISIAGGTVLWGDSIRTGGTSLSLCPTVRKVVRATAGQTLQLMTCNGSGGAISLQGANASAYSTLVACFRGF